jgi:hypothetical protein
MALLPKPIGATWIIQYDSHYTQAGFRNMILGFLVMMALLALALCIPPVRVQADQNPAAMRKILLALSQSAKTLANATASGDLQVANGWRDWTDPELPLHGYDVALR